ncbi:MAG: transcription-repair coupling factor [Rudaea sp.]|uniref:transcription-repair coupling factor n=1 Tax=unclassified Rudaea TaxID=2627037 RepID=UPI0010F9653D|nr:MULTISPECIES: transcription-repair coupling factor [unclassified Rudaea]MBN8886638.1 transcription-repair coupling factor [Rudaea sp.]MBR0346119.1 transcription-repair coupling factor [Rudaea sp.]
MTDSLLLHPPLPRDPKQRRYWNAPHGSSLALAIAAAARAHDSVVVAVTRDTHAAHTLETDLRTLAGDAVDVLHFPDWETLPYDLFPPHPEIVSQRISALYRLPTTKRGVLVVPASTLMQRLAPRSFIGGSSLVLALKQTLDLATEQRRLEAAGYRNVPQVLEPGDFAVRGALLDIFPMGTNEPYRIELFDREIESIRTFDPETQRSAHKVDKVSLLPAREFPLTEESVKAFRNTLRERFPIDPRHCPIYQDIKEGTTPAGIEYYLPLFFAQTETLFDYLSESAVFVLAENALDAAETFWQQALTRYDSRAHDIERPILPVAELYLPPQELRERLNRSLRVEIVAKGSNEHAVDLGTQSAPSVPLNQRGEEPAQELKRFLDAYPGRVLIAADSAGRREALVEQLAGMNLRPKVVASWNEFFSARHPGDTRSVNGEAGPEAERRSRESSPTDEQRFFITAAALDDGFALTEPALAVLTDRQLYGERARATRRRKHAVREPEAILRDLSELTIGAPIVHADHGVGRYQGLIKLDVGGAGGEFLCIDYAKGDKLYVPVAQLHLVSRYSGAAPELAPLHSLGGEAWEKAKRKAAQKVRDVAAELLALYAQREARGGTAFVYDRNLYEQFAAAFPFEETPDQLRAIEAVIADLASGKSMDRVVCGDVGFGKTEVALRAAFVAATAGKQVAMLAPTTLLAQQHYQNFRDRYADWPVRVEVISRFKSKKEVEEALKKLEDGQIDVMIGTHRLLQPDIKFKDLGLVIVDEEQRFGVRQKEALKKLRAEVDLLTLTATPIPRTLNMSMSGLRDLSIIATPPSHRLAVKTFVAAWDTALVREAFQRELARGGQVYFLHNEVETIEKTARELGELVPEARLRVAHGQMPERELEQVMLDFYRQRFNVLVCTTIIESGIDVPSANTIVINRADRFGLSQLHQLRGRVGRSHHRAYAYLVVPDKRSITADAEKRLEAIASLEELGAGFTLATHDLEIRGAGELLGEEQSGQIEAVGFSLYSELLERAVRALKSGKVPDFDLVNEHDAEIELHVPALIPDDYLPDVHARLTLYKRIASARDAHALRELQIEMIDRFGLLPDPVKHLFVAAALKLAATAMGIKKLELGERGGRVLFKPTPNIDPMRIIKLIQAQPKVYSLDGQDKFKIRMELPGAAERIGAAQSLLTALGGRLEQ